MAFLGFMSRLRKHTQPAERVVFEESKCPSKGTVLGRQDEGLIPYLKCLFAKERDWRAMLDDVKYGFLW